MSTRTLPAADMIRVRGARTHNLQNVDIDIPQNQLVVVTGPSGSGKSSLAFDTILAEGQRQYFESLSVYTRQYLDQMQRPNVDEITGLQPSLCIDQHPGNANPRSTVATVTEVYDYLRLMMARLGDLSCYACGTPVSQQAEEEIQQAIMRLPEKSKTMILAPMVRGRQGKHEDVFAAIRKAGFVRVRVDGEVYDLENVPSLNVRKMHTIEAVIDRVIIRPGAQSRISESVSRALKMGEGLLVATHLDNSTSPPEWKDEVFSTLYACPSCGLSYEEIEPRTFSFNSPYGACPECDGLGVRDQFDPGMLTPDRSKSLASGGITAWQPLSAAAKKKVRAAVEPYIETQKYTWDTPLKELSAVKFDKLLYGDGARFEGVVTMLEKEFATTTRAKRLEELAELRGDVPCQACGGSRLRPEAGAVRLGGLTMHELVSLPVSDAVTFLRQLDFTGDAAKIAAPVLKEALKRLDFLLHTGVGYLTLGRRADTLSGGELQRVRLATSIGSGLTGVCYVLDEPTIGLHSRDNDRLIQAIQDLQQQGNTVLVVEHDEAMMRAAGRIIDVGPGAGSRGGRITAAGAVDEIIANEGSITGDYLSGRKQIAAPDARRAAKQDEAIVVHGASLNNLQDVTATFPLGLLLCVTGVSGSGKSSLVGGVLTRAVHRALGNVAPAPGAHQKLTGVEKIDKLIEVTQAPIGRTPRSNAATYCGAFDEIRKVFAGTRDAKRRGYKANRFSFNVKGGRCETCQGQGMRKIEMNFLPDMYVQCEACGGARFNRQTLLIKYRGKSIADILAMPVDEALEFFQNFTAIRRLLESMQQTGLGYLPLGQPSTTLSGGEAQRIKLATQLSRTSPGHALYVLDEPTTGLHFDDIARLLRVLNQLVDAGNTVLVIEHNLDIIRAADWLIDLGPDGGAGGGRIVAEGTPEQVAANPASVTGRYL